MQVYGICKYFIDRHKDMHFLMMCILYDRFMVLSLMEHPLMTGPWKWLTVLHWFILSD